MRNLQDIFEGILDTEDMDITNDDMLGMAGVVSSNTQFGNYNCTLDGHLIINQDVLDLLHKKIEGTVKKCITFRSTKWDFCELYLQCGIYDMSIYDYTGGHLHLIAKKPVINSRCEFDADWLYIDSPNVMFSDCKFDTFNSTMMIPIENVNRNIKNNMFDRCRFNSRTELEYKGQLDIPDDSAQVDVEKVFGLKKCTYSRDIFIRYKKPGAKTRIFANAGKVDLRHNYDYTMPTKKSKWVECFR